MNILQNLNTNFFERADRSDSGVYNSPAPVNYTMCDGGQVPYSVDGLPTSMFVNYDKTYFRKDNWQEPGNQNGSYYTAIGTPTPLRNEDVHYKRPEQTLLPLHWNKVSWDCCPSTYSTSRGCVCTSNRQREYIGMYRGNNKNYYDDAF